MLDSVAGRKMLRVSSTPTPAASAVPGEEGPREPQQQGFFGARGTVGNSQYHDIDTVGRDQGAAECAIDRTQHTCQEQRECGERNRQHEGQVRLQIRPQVNIHDIQVRRDDQQNGARDGASDQDSNSQSAHQFPGGALRIRPADEMLRDKQVVLAAQQCRQPVSNDKAFEINANDGWRQNLQYRDGGSDLQHRGNDAQSQIAQRRNPLLRRWDRALFEVSVTTTSPPTAVMRPGNLGPGSLPHSAPQCFI